MDVSSQLYVQKHVGSLKSVMMGVFTTEISKCYKSWLFFPEEQLLYTFQHTTGSGL